MLSAVAIFSSLLSCGRWVGAAVLAVTLAACGGDSSPLPPASPPPQTNDALTSFTQQKLDWKPCDSSVMGEGENAFTQLGARAQCAWMRAPLDYAHPARGELKVALLRVQAEQPRQRLGAIWFNPGGPGADGLVFAAQYAALWATANPVHPTGKLLKSLSERYDLIGFSPRGVGSSSQLIWSAPAMPELGNSLVFDRSAQNLKNAQYNARLTAQTAAKNPLTPYIHTEATARDLDLMRELIGDARINYMGYSYGTWLGAWYAGLFPERVGRMLLDSSMNIVGSFDDNVQSTEVGRQRVIDEVMLPYVARHPDLFKLGDSVPQLRSKLLALPPQLKAKLFSALDFGRSSQITSNALYMTAAIGVQSLRQKDPEASLEALLEKIASHQFTASAPYQQTAVDMAQWLAKQLFSTPERTALFSDARDSTHWSVRCNDTDTRGDEQYWLDVGNERAASYPFSGGDSTFNPCLHWETPARTRSPLTNASRAGPLLMLQSRNDAETAFEGAMASLDALPNASMIMVENEYQHGLFPYGQDCVDAPVAAYFLHGSMPARLSSCAGKPLAGDAGPASRQLRTQAVATYKDAVQAEELMARIHRQIGKAARQGF